MASNYTDTAYCPFCDVETNQEFYDAGHERDSSNNWQECLECGCRKSYYNDKWFTQDGEEVKRD